MPPPLRPAGLIQVEVCPVSGGARTELCPTARVELFTTGDAPKPCTVHSEVAVCTVSGGVATEHCPDEDVEQVVFEDYGPPWDAWARERGLTVAPQNDCPITTYTGHEPPNASQPPSRANGGMSRGPTEGIEPARPPVDLYDRYETDDTAPSTISLGETQWRNFNPSGDVDLVFLAIQPGTRYCIEALPRAPGVDPVLTVTTAGVRQENDNCSAATLRVCLCPEGAGTADLAAMIDLEPSVAPAPGALIKVTNRGRFGPDAWYTLRAYQPDRDSASDPYEPNDQIPSPIAPGDRQRHLFHPGGDIDRAQLAVRAGHSYQVWTFGLAEGVDTHLSALVGGIPISNDNVAPDDTSSRLSFTAPRDGFAGITVTNRGSFGGEQYYWLAVDEGPIPETRTPVAQASPSPKPSDTCRDPFEPDDLAPRPIPVGETRARSFCPQGDVDRLSFAAQGSHRYRIETHGLALGVDTRLKVASRGLVVENDNGAEGSLGSVVEWGTPDGTEQLVFVTITNNGRHDPGATYLLTITDLGPPEPSGDPFEPDTVERRYIAPGEIQVRTFDPVGDVDEAWLRVQQGARYQAMACGHPISSVDNGENLGSCASLPTGAGALLTASGPILDCEPAGCQSDSQNSAGQVAGVTFAAESDGEVRIRVFRSAGSFGQDAAYALQVLVASPAQQVSPTSAPAGTPSATPHGTATTAASPTSTATPQVERESASAPVRPSETPAEHAYPQGSLTATPTP